MSWNTFRNRVLTTMTKPGTSMSELVDAIVSGYDITMRTPPAGDFFNGKFVVTSNTEGFKSYVYSQFLIQSTSPIHLPILLNIAKGFPIYWVGATLSTGLPPITPPGGIATVSATVLNTGIPPVLPIQTGKSQTPEEFVDGLIQLAKLHLYTISGTLMVAYPSPTGTITIPVPWFGYRVMDTPKVQLPTLDEYLKFAEVNPSDFYLKLTSNQIVNSVYTQLLRQDPFSDKKIKSLESTSNQSLLSVIEYSKNILSSIRG